MGTPLRQVAPGFAFRVSDFAFRFQDKGSGLGSLRFRVSAEGLGRGFRQRV